MNALLNYFYPVFSALGHWLLIRRIVTEINGPCDSSRIYIQFIPDFTWIITLLSFNVEMAELNGPEHWHQFSQDTSLHGIRFIHQSTLTKTRR